MRGIGRLRRAVRRYVPRLMPGSPILLYHRVAEPEVDPWALCVSPAHFEEQMAVLRRRARPVSLQDIAGGVGRLPGFAVAVTFDDGYADNLLHAMPVLERYEIPAAVFVTTSRLDQDAAFWWDELERLLLLPGRLPRSPRLIVGDRPYSWDLGESEIFSADDAGRYGQWKAWEDAPTRRHNLYLQLYDLLSPLGPREQWAALDRLRALGDVPRTVRATNRVLTADEVRALDQSHLIEIGAHTVNHPNLASLSVPAQTQEIKGGKDRLEDILGHPLRGFAYPFGRRSDYTVETIAAVRSCGFSYACSNFAGLATTSTDCFQLPRMQVQDWGGAEFERRLRGWFG